MKNVTTFLLALVALSLSACGGGGGSASTGSSEAPTGSTSLPSSESSSGGTREKSNSSDSEPSASDDTESLSEESASKTSEEPSSSESEPSASDDTESSSEESASKTSAEPSSSESKESSSSEQPTAVILSVDGGELDETNRTVWMFVEPGITNVPLSGLVNVSPDAKWKLYRGETEIPTKIASTKDGYLLDGDNPFSIVVTSSDGLTENVYGLTIHHSYQISVSYTYQGEVLGTDPTYTGYEFELPKEYDVNGYSLSHWLLDGERVTKITPWGDLEVEAVPGPAISYAIQYDLDEGVSNPNPDSYTVEDGPITLLDPTWDGYDFLGWYDENGDRVWRIDTKTVKGIALTAKWASAGLVIENGVVTGLVDDFDQEKVFIPDSVTSIGDYAFGYCSSLTSISIPVGVTSIGDYAFSHCSSLTSVTIPFSVASIGYRAFLGCSSLMSITVDKANPKYDSRDGCNAIIETGSNELLFGCAGTVIPGSVTSIGESAFIYCSSLTSVAIPDSVTSIGYCAFDECSSLASVTIPDSVTSIGGHAFSCCSSLVSVVIHNGVTSIGPSAFSACTSLTSIVIPGSATSINHDAFSGCVSLESITVDKANPKYDSRDGCNAIIETASNELLLGCAGTVIPGSVTSIGDYAFEHCSSLASVVIPDSVASIGYMAFSHCSSIESIAIPANVAIIKACAFYNCSSLRSMTVDKANPKYDSRDGCNAIIETASNELLLGCAGTLIPGSVTSIGDYAFSGCSSLASVTIPDSVTSISGCAFEGCSSLASIVIPDSVTYIDSYAFACCTSLASIVIPDSVTYIGSYAFAGCTSLKKSTVKHRGIA